MNEGRPPPTEERIMMALSAKEAAAELGTDARTFRKFMRDTLPKDSQPGQGNRYSIEEKEVRKLKKKFDAWSKGKKKPTKKDKVKKDKIIDHTPEEDDVEEVDDEEFFIADDEIDADTISDEDFELLDDLD
jgi:hypothetical protein